MLNFFANAAASSHLCLDIQLFPHILNLACRGGYLSVVKDLIANRADVNTKDDVRYKTFYMDMIQDGSVYRCDDSP